MTNRESGCHRCSNDICIAVILLYARSSCNYGVDERIPRGVIVSANESIAERAREGDGERVRADPSSHFKAELNELASHCELLLFVIVTVRQNRCS